MAKQNVLDTIEAEPQKKGKSEIQVIPVKGTIVSRYAQACDDLAAARKKMEELRPQLQAVGLEYVFNFNIEVGGQPKDAISSVNLVDRDSAAEALESVDRVQFTWTTKDLKNDPKTVKAIFEAVTDKNGNGVVMDDYCEWRVTGKWNDGIFLSKDPATGESKFDGGRYTRVVAAMEALAKEMGTDNPLTCKKILAPKDDFSARRFQDFDYETNVLFMSALPNALALEAIRPAPAGVVVE